MITASSSTFTFNSRRYSKESTKEKENKERQEKQKKTAEKKAAEKKSKLVDGAPTWGKGEWPWSVGVDHRAKERAVGRCRLKPVFAHPE